MAVYHMSTKPVPRSAGRSAPASAAYRSGDRIEEYSTGKVWDYTRKQGVEHTEIVLPTEAARRDINWARDREQLWNAAEAFEKRKDSRVAREWEIALPHELSKTQRVDLAREFAGEIANRYGCAVDVAIHRPHRLGDDRNHHAHLFATTRTVEAVGLGRKTDIELGDRDRGKKGLGTGADEIKFMRARWETLINQRLKELGIEARVDHRSLKAQGIEREPTVHLGPSVIGMERRGIATEVGDRVREERAAELERAQAKAAELKSLERESREVEKSILDLSGDLKAALKERDQRLALEAEPRTGKRSPFEGLTLGVGRGGAERAAFTGLQLPGDRSPERTLARGEMLQLAPDDLSRALDRYANAWTDAARMPAQGFPVLEHQKVALKEAGAELERIRPGAKQDLGNALAYEPSVHRAMTTLQGPERTAQLLAGLRHEERVRVDPTLRAERLVKAWNGLEVQHERLRGAEHTEAREKVEQGLRGLARDLKHDLELETIVRHRSRALGIEMGSPLDRVMRERNLERAIGLSVPELGRSLGLSR
jgi:hypothetical protein